MTPHEGLRARRALKRTVAAATLVLVFQGCTTEPGPPLAELEARSQRGERLGELDLRDRDLHGARLAGADLSGADLRGARLAGAELRDGKLVGSLLVNADLTRADLEAADLREAMMQATRMHQARLPGADLRRANVERADLTEANLEGARLEGAYLWSANLRGAKLRGADVRGADLRSANLGGTDLTEVANLTQRQLDYACTDGDVALPDGFAPPGPCPRPPGTNTAAASAVPGGVTVSGKVHCGDLEKCTPQRFLVFTPHGGKIVQVTDADADATAALFERLADGAEVVLRGVDPAVIPQHRYFVPAARIEFPG